MKRCPKCELEKEAADFAMNRRTHSGLNVYCRACSSQSYYENRDSLLEGMRARYYANREDRIEKMRAYSIANKAKLLEAKRLLYIAMGDGARKRSRENYQRNKSWYIANVARRKAMQLQATPGWANRFFISEAYRLSALRGKVCGGKWHVDHIVPLKSPLVCGLHVECNLQVIPEKVNNLKGNRFWPDMPSTFTY